MHQGPLDTTDEFCSYKLADNSGNTIHGCVFRLAGSPGTHYHTIFHNPGDEFYLESRDGFSGVDFVTGTTDCSCTWPGDAADGDYMGIHLVGTGQGGTAVSFWDFGSTPASDMNDPSTWGTATCECTNAEVGAVTFTELDTADNCGPFGQASNPAATHEPVIDDFACGDTP
jgi:hypothetical protein